VKSLKTSIYGSEKCDEEFEITRPHGAGLFYNYLLSYKFKKAVNALPFSIGGLSVLDVCCGSGMFSEYYAQSGATVSGVDLSESAIACAKLRKKRYNFEAEFQAVDATKLPFPDNAFDLVSVHDGLHHIPEPLEAIKEMVRVSRKGIIIIEPAKASLTKLSVKLGTSLAYEGDDFVYRFKESEIRRWLNDLGIKSITTKRYLMYYPHIPGKTFCFLGLPIIYCLSKMAFGVINMVFGRFGNKIQVIALK